MSVVDFITYEGGGGGGRGGSARMLGPAAPRSWPWRDQVTRENRYSVLLQLYLRTGPGVCIGSVGTNYSLRQR
jgi:hypothetical protein